MRNEIINKLLQLSEQEHNRHPEWRKGQSIINCTYIYCEHLTKDFMHTKVDCFYKDSLINDFLKLLEEKIKTSEPFVGIFWFYNGFVIFPHAVQLTNGLHYGNTITGTKDHADYWDELAGHLSSGPSGGNFLGVQVPFRVIFGSLYFLIVYGVRQQGFLFISKHLFLFARLKRRLFKTF